MVRFIFYVKSILAALLLLAFTGAAAQQDSTLIIHTVQQGENLYRISLKYNVTVGQIMAWNNIPNADRIKAGQLLEIWMKGEAEYEEDDDEYTGREEKTPVIEPETPPAQVSMPPQDTIKKRLRQDEISLEYTGTRIAPKEEEFDTSGRLDITGYISAYYAHYTDSVGQGQYQKFPTHAPISDNAGINILMISAKYKSEKVRGIITLHWGDLPLSAWSAKLNLIQQANLGIRVVPRLWFDIGYFRTHFGLESVQPRENINSSMALTTFFEPYYLTGAKLTWQASSKLALQVNTFSQFNGYTENNRDKAVGISAICDFSPSFSLTFNSMTSDDAPDNAILRQRRVYNDLYMIYKSKRLVLGYELNAGFQQNSGLKDSTANAKMLGSLLAVKYKISKRVSIYTREEYYRDDDGMMSGLYNNSYSQKLGLNIWGTDVGIEIKPIPNSYVRFEYRHLHENTSDGNIFYYRGNYRTFRNEFIFSTGFWF